MKNVVKGRKLNELSKEYVELIQDSVEKMYDFSFLEIKDLSKEYEAILKKKKVNPEIIHALQVKSKKLTELLELLDIVKSLINSEIKNEEKHTPKSDVDIFEKIKEECPISLSEHVIKVGIDIARNNPNSKLNAVKQFKSYTNLGLKNTKDFMDMCWKVLDNPQP